MCIKNIPFPGGGLPMIRRAVMQGEPLHLLNKQTKEVIMIWPKKELGQIRDSANRKGFIVVVDGETESSTLALDSAGWQLQCSKSPCS